MALDFDKLADAVKDEQKATLSLTDFKKAVDNWQKLIGDISEIEQKLKELTIEERRYSEDVIPSMLALGGITKLPLDNGRVVEVKNDLHASLPKARLAEIMTDIRTRGAEDMIKNIITIPLDKGKDNVAAEIEQKALELGLEAERSESVAPQTYKKWLRTRMEAGESVDLAFYGAYSVTKAKLSQ